MTSTPSGWIALGAGVSMVGVGSLVALWICGAVLFGERRLPPAHAMGAALAIGLGAALLAIADTTNLGRAESADLISVPFVALAATSWWGLARRYGR